MDNKEQNIEAPLQEFMAIHTKELHRDSNETVSFTFSYMFSMWITYNIKTCHRV